MKEKLSPEQERLLDCIGKKRRIPLLQLCRLYSPFNSRTVRSMVSRGYITRRNNVVHLTDKGRDYLTGEGR